MVCQIIPLEALAFADFTAEQVEKIAALEFNQLCVLLKDQDIRAELSDDALKKLGRDGYTIELGARPIQRTIEKDIINKLSVDIITGDVSPGDAVIIDVKDDAYAFTVKEKS